MHSIFPKIGLNMGPLRILQVSELVAFSISFSISGLPMNMSE